jgi:hypothetical protein
MRSKHKWLMSGKIYFISPSWNYHFFLHFIKRATEINTLNQTLPFTYHNVYAIWYVVLLCNLSKILSSYFSFWSVWKLMKPSAWLPSSENTSTEQALTVCSNLLCTNGQQGVYFCHHVLFFELFYMAGKG